ncbi:unnamed protein product [Dibothriocephalus latus]|uniref:Uncharacterized protein n=1 Tax=Dibothriocephalus latus TaxID=60516 RepID=A0A3P7LML0_DIBLA|nr:unnamed protein product [Dibothriocephalus latus]
MAHNCRIAEGFRKIATQKLAETQPESANFGLNVHRACLLAASVYIQSLEAQTAESSRSAARLNYNSTVKLLAANMISNNHLHEGVELLCMLGLHVDACRYLETYNEWDRKTHYRGWKRLESFTGSGAVVDKATMSENPEDYSGREWPSMQLRESNKCSVILQRSPLKRALNAKYNALSWK